MYRRRQKGQGRGADWAWSKFRTRARTRRASDEFPEKDDKAKDGGDDPEKTNDEFPEKAKDEKDDEDKAEDEDVEGMDDVQPKVTATPGPSGKKPEPAKDKKGMDAAGVAALIAANDAKHAAAREVESILGVVAYDSAAEYYKAALVKLGVDTDGVHASAFPSLLKIAKDTARTRRPRRWRAMPPACLRWSLRAIRGYDRLR